MWIKWNVKKDFRINLLYFLPNRNPPSVHCNVTAELLPRSQWVTHTLQLVPNRLQTQALVLPQHFIPFTEQDIPKGIQITILVLPLPRPPRLAVDTQYLRFSVKPSLVLVEGLHRQGEVRLVCWCQHGQVLVPGPGTDGGDLEEEEEWEARVHGVMWGWRWRLDKPLPPSHDLGGFMSTPAQTASNWTGDKLFQVRE